MNHGSLFSGIGGFDLAAEWMGWTNAFHCEWEEFPRKVLQYHFPESKSYGDINETDFTIWNGRIDVLTGGFPCQPYSIAGHRRGKEDERHLWPEMLRAIREIEPRWVIGENVYGLVNWNDGLVFDEVQVDLENEGYQVQAYILPAAGVNAPHKRDRVWFVAHTSEFGRGRGHIRPKADKEAQQPLGQSVGQYGNDVRSQNEGRGTDATDTQVAGSEGQRIEGQGQTQLDGRSVQDARARWDSFPTQPPVCGGDDGIPRELDSITFPKWRSESIKAYGNAIVPQVALQLFKTIHQYEQSQT
jgi:DNA (cytosine-5)-methyltransferase 1